MIRIVVVQFAVSLRHVDRQIKLHVHTAINIVQKRILVPFLKFEHLNIADVVQPAHDLKGLLVVSQLDYVEFALTQQSLDATALGAVNTHLQWALKVVSREVAERQLEFIPFGVRFSAELCILFEKVFTP